MAIPWLRTLARDNVHPAGLAMDHAVVVTALSAPAMSLAGLHADSMAVGG